MKTNPSVVAVVILILAGACLMVPRVHAQSLLFSDAFETDTSSEWDVFEGSGNGVADFSAEFGFDYSASQIPPAPNTEGDTTLGLKFTVNNNDDVADTAAVSVYPKGQNFSGNYAVRFDMWINYNGGAWGGSGSTEFGIFGINHSADKVNWANGTDSDGVWFAVTGEGGAGRDYRSYDGISGLAPEELQGFDASFLDRDGDGAVEFNVNSGQESDFPLKMVFPVPPSETPGAVGKQWVQGEVRQRDDEITWLLNGHVIARRLNFSEFNSGNVMIGYMDIFTSIADPREENFVIYDNVRVVDLDAIPAIPEVSVEVIDAEAAEPRPDTASFSVGRTGPTTASLTVPFRFSGSATPGLDYAINNFPVIIPAGSSATTVTITTLDDQLGEPTETIVLLPVGSSDYDIGEFFRATAELFDDNDVTSVDVEATDAHIYERIAEDTGSFSIVRLGDTSIDLTVNVMIAGTAQSGADYSGAVSSVVIPVGEASVSIILEANDNSDVEGDETIILTVLDGPGYVAGVSKTATINLKDDDLPPATNIYSDDFNTDSSAQWTAQFGSNNDLPDYTAEFAYDYGFDGIDPAPSSEDGSTLGLRIAVNKDEPTAGGAGGVNLYPNAQAFEGNWALRFEMFLSFSDDTGGTTEHAIFGINHSGTLVNRHATAGSDGFWFAVETDGSASGGGRSIVAYQGEGETAPATFEALPAGDFADIFTNPPYLASGAVSGQWVDVEVAQIGDEITLRINGSVVMQEINDSDFKSGKFMLGHMDTFNSIGSLSNFVIYDNVRVVSLPDNTPEISIVDITSLSNSQLQITFVATSGEPSVFHLQSSDSVLGPFEDEAVASIETTGEPEEFKVTIASPDSEIRFYRIRF